MKISLANKFPKEILGIIKLIGGSADKKALPVYIVGGPVRDILLNVKNYDMDFVIEGDAINFARVLSDKIKCDLKTHEAFGTATVSFRGIRVDIATARKETYEKPAAYPDIEPASLEEDLFRRDFTINAMAISINEKDFGKLVDFYNGYNDLKCKLIRIMHDKSFIDDPTRIFRAVRFSARFGFKIEPHSKKLIKEAILQGRLGEVNRGRIRKEIELLLKEKKPLKCLQAFSRLI